VLLGPFVLTGTGGGVAEVDLSYGSFPIPAEPPVFRLLESVEPPEGAFPVIRVDVGDPRADPPEPMVSGAALLEPGFPPNQPPFGSGASALGGALPMEGSATLGIFGTFEDPFVLLSIPLGAAGVGTATGGFLDQRDPETGVRIQVWGNPSTTGEVRTFVPEPGPARGSVAAGTSLAAVAFARRRRARDAGGPSP